MQNVVQELASDSSATINVHDHYRHQQNTAQSSTPCSPSTYSKTITSETVTKSERNSLYTSDLCSDEESISEVESFLNEDRIKITQNILVSSSVANVGSLPIANLILRGSADGGCCSPSNSTGSGSGSEGLLVTTGESAVVIYDSEATTSSQTDINDIFLGGISSLDPKSETPAVADPDALRRLSNSVSCALDEATAALTRMRNDISSAAHNSSIVAPASIETAVASSATTAVTGGQTAAAASTEVSAAVASNLHTSASSDNSVSVGGNTGHSLVSASGSCAASKKSLAIVDRLSLVEACTDGDVRTVRKLLTEGRSVHETSEEGESLLSLACSAGYFELAQVLLAMHANVEDRGIKGECTPLMEAASAGHLDIVQLLVAHGADVNAQSTSGNTPLMYGCAGGHEEIVTFLLNRGANVEDHNENGHTPLMEAASAGYVGLAKILLKHGAGINTHSNEFKESALTLACYKGHLDMVKFLLEAGADQEHKTDEMHTALMEASMDGHVEVARLLLDSGAQVNMPTDSFESPLTLAACGGHVDLAMLLIERGANIEEVNDEGYTPLMEAAREGHEDMVALLLNQGANINAQTEETQETALTLACCGGFTEVADFLIKVGADIELGASTPLMEAAQEGHLDLVRYLLQSGANVHSQTQTGDTALTYACENGHTDVADLLLQFLADLEHESEGGRTPLMKACRAGHLCTVQFLINKKADIKRSTSNNDHTPLSLACAGGHLSVVELLLQHNADPNHKLKDNSTMLIEAAKGGHTNVVQLLLDYPHSIVMNQQSQQHQAQQTAQLPTSPPNFTMLPVARDAANAPAQTKQLVAAPLAANVPTTHQPLNFFETRPACFEFPSDALQEASRTSRMTGGNGEDLQASAVAAQANSPVVAGKGTVSQPPGHTSALNKGIAAVNRFTASKQNRANCGIYEGNLAMAEAQQARSDPTNEAVSGLVRAAASAFELSDCDVFSSPSNATISEEERNVISACSRSAAINTVGNILNYVKGRSKFTSDDHKSTQQILEELQQVDREFRGKQPLMFPPLGVSEATIQQSANMNNNVLPQRTVDVAMQQQSAGCQHTPSVPMNVQFQHQFEQLEQQFEQLKHNTAAITSTNQQVYPLTTCSGTTAVRAGGKHESSLSTVNPAAFYNFSPGGNANVIGNAPVLIGPINNMQQQVPPKTHIVTSLADVNQRCLTDPSKQQVFVGSQSTAISDRPKAKPVSKKEGKNNRKFQQQNIFQHQGSQLNIPLNQVMHAPLQHLPSPPPLDTSLKSDLNLARLELDDCHDSILTASILHQFHTANVVAAAAAPPGQPALVPPSQPSLAPPSQPSAAPNPNQLPGSLLAAHYNKGMTPKVRLELHEKSRTLNRARECQTPDLVEEVVHKLETICSVNDIPELSSNKISQIQAALDLNNINNHGSGDHCHDFATANQAIGALALIDGSEIVTKQLLDSLGQQQSLNSLGNNKTSNTHASQQQYLMQSPQFCMSDSTSGATQQPLTDVTLQCGARNIFQHMQSSQIHHQVVQAATQTVHVTPHILNTTSTVATSTSNTSAADLKKSAFAVDACTSANAQSLTAKKKVRVMPRQGPAPQQNLQLPQQQPNQSYHIDPNAAITQYGNSTAILPLASQQSSMVHVAIGTTIPALPALPGAASTLSNNTQVAQHLTTAAPNCAPAVQAQQSVPNVASVPNTSVAIAPVSSGYSMNVDSETESNHDTALTLACAGGHEELVELLISRGADIEHRDKKGFTPLILAATAGHEKVVDILIRENADIEAQSERTKDTPLSLACSGGRFEVVDLLLNKNANKEHRNVSDYTPLSLAASGGYVNIIRLLLNHGAEINSRTGSKLGISPLMLAAMNGHTTAVKLLLDMGSDINAQIETNRNTALTLACFQGRHEVVSLLLDRKANVEHRAKTGLTPLMEAASGGYVDVGRVLLDKGADVNATPVPSSRDTALTIAADKGHHRFVQLLLSRSASVEVKNKKGNSPLWLAAFGGHLQVVQELFETAHADIDSQDNRKVSCLMAAFRKGHTKVVKWMVDHVTQFPSDQEMIRFISTISDKDLLDKCQECVTIIRAAKETQAAKANENASILLLELDREKNREELKKAAAAKRRERKKKKKQEKKVEKKKMTSDGDRNDPYEDDDDKDKDDKDDDDEDDDDMDLQGATANNSDVIQKNPPIDVVDKEEGDSGIDANSQGSCSSSDVKTKEKRKEKKKKKTNVAANGSSSSLAVQQTVKQELVSITIAREQKFHDKEDNNVSSAHKAHKSASQNINHQQSTTVRKGLVFESTRNPADRDTFEITGNETVYKSSARTNLKLDEQVSGKTLSPKSNSTTKREEGWKEVVRKSSSVQQQQTSSTANTSSSTSCPDVTNTGTVSNNGATVSTGSTTASSSSGGTGSGGVKKVSVPLNAISRVIGRGGSNINAIRGATGAHIEVEKQSKGQGERIITIKGSMDAIKQAHSWIQVLIRDPDVDILSLLRNANKIATSSATLWDKTQIGTRKVTTKYPVTASHASVSVVSTNKQPASNSSASNTSSRGGSNNKSRSGGTSASGSTSMVSASNTNRSSASKSIADKNPSGSVSAQPRPGSLGSSHTAAKVVAGTAKMPSTIIPSQTFAAKLAEINQTPNSHVLAVGAKSRVAQSPSSASNVAAVTQSATTHPTTSLQAQHPASQQHLQASVLVTASTAASNVTSNQPSPKHHRPTPTASAPPNMQLHYQQHSSNSTSHVVKTAFDETAATNLASLASSASNSPVRQYPQMALSINQSVMASVSQHNAQEASIQATNVASSSSSSSSSSGVPQQEYTLFNTAVGQQHMWQRSQDTDIKQRKNFASVTSGNRQMQSVHLLDNNTSANNIASGNMMPIGSGVVPMKFVAEESALQEADASKAPGYRGYSVVPICSSSASTKTANSNMLMSQSSAPSVTSTGMYNMAASNYNDPAVVVSSNNTTSPLSIATIISPLAPIGSNFAHRQSGSHLYMNANELAGRPSPVDGDVNYKPASAFGGKECDNNAHIMQQFQMHYATTTSQAVGGGQSMQPVQNISPATMSRLNPKAPDFSSTQQQQQQLQTSKPFNGYGVYQPQPIGPKSANQQQISAAVGYQRPMSSASGCGLPPSQSRWPIMTSRPCFPPQHQNDLIADGASTVRTPNRSSKSPVLSANVSSNGMTIHNIARVTGDLFDTSAVGGSNDHQSGASPAISPNVATGVSTANNTAGAVGGGAGGGASSSNEFYLTHGAPNPMVSDAGHYGRMDDCDRKQIPQPIGTERARKATYGVAPQLGVGMSTASPSTSNNWNMSSNSRTSWSVMAPHLDGNGLACTAALPHGNASRLTLMPRSHYSDELPQFIDYTQPQSHMPLTNTYFNNIPEHLQQQPQHQLQQHIQLHGNRSQDMPKMDFGCWDNQSNVTDMTQLTKQGWPGALTNKWNGQ